MRRGLLLHSPFFAHSLHCSSSSSSVQLPDHTATWSVALISMSRLWAIAWTRPVHTPQNFCAGKQSKKRFGEQLFQVQQPCQVEQLLQLDLVPVSGFGEAGPRLWGCGEGDRGEQLSQVQQPSQVEQPFQVEGGWTESRLCVMALCDAPLPTLLSPGHLQGAESAS